MRRTLVFAALTALAVLATAGIAAADDAGFAPPAPASPNAHHINEAYWLVAAFTAAIFVIVETALVVFIVRYRSRTRDRRIEGAQLHGHTRLELIWTAIPIVIVSAIFAFVLYKLPQISGPSKALAAGEKPLRIKVDAHQFYWQFTYPNGATSIDELHLPLGKVVELTINSEDVDHSWWIPNLGGKTDAIPGRTNHTWYKPEKLGRFEGQCAELCGLFHERMLATAVVESDADYRSFITATAGRQLGKMEWQGVCAKCHGMQGQGDYGPAVNANPLITEPKGLGDLVRNGRGRMPAVGNNWTDAQLRALAQYVKSNVYQGASSGG